MRAYLTCRKKSVCFILFPIGETFVSQRGNFCTKGKLLFLNNEASISQQRSFYFTPKKLLFHTEEASISQRRSFSFPSREQKSLPRVPVSKPMNRRKAIPQAFASQRTGKYKTFFFYKVLFARFITSFSRRQRV